MPVKYSDSPLARFHKPRMPPWYARLWARSKRWRQLKRERRQLRELSDALLRDIGLTRREADREWRRPFWDDGGWYR
ncbi:DUF1127 domain-containing protein [Halomonas sp. PA5]|nr:DUF1127 domain-containing protein [Halomonas sp. PA5]